MENLINGGISDYYYWLYSTVSQCIAALIGIVCLLGVSKMQYAMPEFLDAQRQREKYMVSKSNPVENHDPKKAVIWHFVSESFQKEMIEFGKKIVFIIGRLFLALFLSLVGLCFAKFLEHNVAVSWLWISGALISITFGLLLYSMLEIVFLCKSVFCEAF